MEGMCLYNNVREFVGVLLFTEECTLSGLFVVF